MSELKKCRIEWQEATTVIDNCKYKVIAKDDKVEIKFITENGYQVLSSADVTIKKEALPWLIKVLTEIQQA